MVLRWAAFLILVLQAFSIISIVMLNPKEELTVYGIINRIILAAALFAPACAWFSSLFDEFSDTFMFVINGMVSAWLAAKLID